HRRLLPACAIGGGLFLALCDVFARALPFAATPPVGVVTAALGAPALVILLARKHR
ncbi:MAG: iron chelate uptake ABC transporter family permease subunit, partial [Kiritimatiellae bacterium]|nr:iron chelate uptake ABC transporter family permease subunit [Kiritimatiellia bacterium]